MTTCLTSGLWRAGSLVLPQGVARHHWSRSKEGSGERVGIGIGISSQVSRSFRTLQWDPQHWSSPLPKWRSHRHMRTARAVLAEERDTEEPTSSGNHVPEQGLEKWVVKAEKAFNELATEAVIKVLDGFYANRDYARFYVLETIARVPYFAFVSVLHMYESFGWWRRADYLQVHFAESWNELHHLLTMEALGGDERWVDRFLAQHIAVGYYFMTVVMYLLSPRMAYHFSECVEKHAFHTYDEFIKLHGEELKKLPAPEVAVKYYTQGDLYLFDEFQTHSSPNSRRPKIENLYDVFYNIREDEAQHCKTMLACQTRGNLRSPHSTTQTPAPTVTSVTKLETEDSINIELAPAECAGIIECAITSSSFVDRARKKGIEVKLDQLPQ